MAQVDADRLAAHRLLDIDGEVLIGHVDHGSAGVAVTETYRVRAVAGGVDKVAHEGNGLGGIDKREAVRGRVIQNGQGVGRTGTRLIDQIAQRASKVDSSVRSSRKSMAR